MYIYTQIYIKLYFFDNTKPLKEPLSSKIKACSLHFSGTLKVQFLLNRTNADHGWLYFPQSQSESLQRFSEVLEAQSSPWHTHQDHCLQVCVWTLILEPYPRIF